MYDFLIVGSGLFGSVFSYEMKKKGLKCLVIDKRSHTGGNIYTECRNGINLHLYGAHIFHTNNKKIWDYVNDLVQMNNYINSPIANYKGELYNLPFNMNTFYAMWGVYTKEKVLEIINEQKKIIKKEPTNLEEQAISLVGKDIYNKLIKGYTEKQWGCKCSELPPDIIKRLPVRFIFDNNYFNDFYQGIPKNGYSELIDKLLEETDVELNVDYNKHRDIYKKKAKKILYTGMIDALYDFSLGELEYRSEYFEHKLYDTDNYQSVAVMNWTDNTPLYTRSIEHKHFDKYNDKCEQNKTWVSFEYPCDYKKTGEPYYPINNEKNNKLYQKYKELAEKDGIILGGRLALYKYLDMDKTIEEALNLVKQY